MKMVLVEGKRQKRGGCSCVKENRRNVVVVVVGAKEKIDSPNPASPFEFRSLGEKNQEQEVQRLPQSWFKTTFIVFYNNISAGLAIPAFFRFTDVTKLM